MKKNMGSADRAIRGVLAVVFGVVIFSGSVTGILAVVLGVFAAAFVLTGATGFCPLYAPFGFSTLKKTG